MGGMLIRQSNQEDKDLRLMIMLKYCWRDDGSGVCPCWKVLYNGRLGSPCRMRGQTHKNTSDAQLWGYVGLQWHRRTVDVVLAAKFVRVGLACRMEGQTHKTEDELLNKPLAVIQECNCLKELVMQESLLQRDLWLGLTTQWRGNSASGRKTTKFTAIWKSWWSCRISTVDLTRDEWRCISCEGYHAVINNWFKRKHKHRCFPLVNDRICKDKDFSGEVHWNWKLLRERSWNMNHYRRETEVRT